jgi:hypothetical protein
VPRIEATAAVRLGRRLLQRDIERRLAGFARGCADAELVADILIAGSPRDPDPRG